MSTSDLYNMLGIERDATVADVKSAYRALARKWHPDHNPHDDLASRRFKDIDHAYRTLSNPQTRARYDRLGPLYTEDGKPPKPEVVREVVQTFWQNLTGRKKPLTGRDLHAKVTLTLEEIVTRSEHTVTVERMTRCTRCKARGSHPDKGEQSCSACKGTGRPSGPWLLRTRCYHCEGRGYTVVKACPDCAGHRRIKTVSTIRLTLPEGVVDGQSIRVAHHGDDPEKEGASGHLYVGVDIQEHEHFVRQDRDLYVTLPLMYSELALGTDAVIPTLEGSSTITILPGTVPGARMKLAGRGLPSPQTSNRGDLHVEVELEIPHTMTDAQRTQLQRWNDELGEAAHPRAHKFRSSTRKRS